MKVLMIPSWYSTPQMPVLGSFFKEQAEALAALGVEMAVLYTDVGRGNPNAGILREVVNGVLTYRYIRPNLTPGWERGRAFQRTQMLRKLYRLLVEEWGRPDVVNLRSSLQGYEVLDLCRREKLPLFLMEHSSYVVTQGEGSAARKRLYRVMDAAAVNACVGTTLHRIMQPYKETRIIPDFVDGERFYIKDPAQLVEPKQPDAPFRFHAMGQLRHIKGHDILIKAFALLKQMTHRPVELHIAGAGELKEQLQQLIDSHGLTDSCRLVGLIPRDQVVDFMNRCDCFICSSRREMLSCVLHECAACGKPAIGTMCGGPQDIITEQTGLLVPPEDPQALAQAMLQMLDTAHQYDPQAIRQSILSRFGKDIVCQQLMQACQDAIQRKDG